MTDDSSSSGLFYLFIFIMLFLSCVSRTAEKPSGDFFCGLVLQ